MQLFGYVVTGYAHEFEMRSQKIFAKELLR
jgi:hypothetical protein